MLLTNIKIDNKKQDDMNYDRIFVMGDWHGLYNKAKNVFDKISFTNNDLLITLGDYTDRGIQNYECIKFFLDLNKRKNVVNLMGNHEWMLVQNFLICAEDYLGEFEIEDLDALLLSDFSQIYRNMMNYDYNTMFYLLNGGMQTLENCQEHIDEFRSYLKIIYNLPLTYRFTMNKNDYFLVHGGIDVSNDLDNQKVDDLLWIRDKFFEMYTGTTKIVIGHTPTQSVFNVNQPVEMKNILFCDTGSYLPNGKISICELSSKAIYQDDFILSLDDMIALGKEVD